MVRYEWYMPGEQGADELKRQQRRTSRETEIRVALAHLQRQRMKSGQQRLRNEQQEEDRSVRNPLFTNNESDERIFDTSNCARSADEFEQKTKEVLGS